MTGKTRVEVDNVFEVRDLVAKQSGHSAYVYLPARWRGRKVKVLLMEPAPQYDRRFKKRAAPEKRRRRAPAAPESA